MQSVYFFINLLAELTMTLLTADCNAKLHAELNCHCPMQHVVFLFLFLIALFILTHIGPAHLTVQGNGKVNDWSGFNFLLFLLLIRIKTWLPSLSCVYVRCRSSVLFSFFFFFHINVWLSFSSRHLFRLEALRWSLLTLWRSWRFVCRWQARLPPDLESVHSAWSVTWASSASTRYPERTTMFSHAAQRWLDSINALFCLYLTSLWSCCLSV